MAEEINLPSGDFNVELVQGGMKAAMAEANAKSRDLLMVPLDQIRIIAGFNVRIHDVEYEAHIEEIKDSIIANGFYQHFPLSGYAGKEGEQTFIYLTGGFTRYEAAKRAVAMGTPIESVPMVLKPPGTSMLDLTFAVAQDNTGEPLRPYERAIIIKRAIGYGATEEDVARRMQISMQYVKDMQYLLGLPNTVQQMVIRGQVSAGHAISVARKHGAEATKVLQDAMEPSEEPAGAANGSASTGTTGRVTPRSTGSGISSKVAMGAIGYAIALPDGLEWLARWFKKDKDAVKELKSVMKPKSASATAAAKKKAANAKKAAEKKAAAAAKKEAVAAKKAAKKAAAADPTFAITGKAADVAKQTDDAPL